MDGTWKIVTVKGQAIPENQMIGNFVVQGQKVSFKYGNQHFGRIQVNGDQVTIGPLASTMMFVALQPPEHTVAQSIQSATKFKIEGDKLNLFDASESVVAELTRV